MSLVVLDKMMERSVTLYSRMAISHLIIAAIVLVVIFVLPGGAGKWGLNLKNWQKSLVLGGIIGISIGILFAVFSSGANIIRWNYGKFLSQLRIKDNAVQFLSQLLLVGLSEELFFRGILVTYLMKKYARKIIGIHQSVIIISALCGLLQFYKLLFGASLGNIFPLAFGGFLYSVLLGWIYQKTGSLLGPVIAHNLGNSLMAIGGLGI